MVSILRWLTQEYHQGEPSEVLEFWLADQNQARQFVMAGHIDINHIIVRDVEFDVDPVLVDRVRIGSSVLHLKR